MVMQYKDPVGGTASNIGTQFRTDFYQKKALIELVKEQFFSPLADVVAMPKHMGKTIKRYHYMPLLDDRNINDQGLDAAGAVIANTEYGIIAPQLVCAPANVEAAEASFTKAHLDKELIYIVDSSQWLLLTDDTAIGYDAHTTGGTTGTEKSDADVKALIEVDTAGVVATVVNDVITLTMVDLVYASEAAAVQANSIIGGSVIYQRSGHIYGSSKDVGTITAKLPSLTENGGEVNRVGFTRIDLEGSIEKFGIYDSYTQESVDFDTDAELSMHVNREMLRGASEITEAAIQIDLLNGAGVTYYGGVATQDSEVTGVTANGLSIVTYDGLMKLAIELDDNRCPKSTTIIKGSRMIDTKVVSAARALFVGSELTRTLQKMTDDHSGQAFIPVAQYADAATLMPGEIGAIGDFRIIVVPDMACWAGRGADEGVNAGYRATAGRYDIFPMLVVGSGSFTTIGFQTDGKTTKFKIKHSAPGSPESYANDPYGETGFMSIKWYYGLMILRSEYIGLFKTIAPE